MGDDSRNNPYPHLLQAQCALQLSKTVALKVTKRAPLPDSTTYNPGKENLKEPNLKEPAQNSERSNQKANFLG